MPPPRRTDTTSSFLVLGSALCIGALARGAQCRRRQRQQQQQHRFSSDSLQKNVLARAHIVQLRSGRALSPRVPSDLAQIIASVRESRQVMGVFPPAIVQDPKALQMPDPTECKLEVLKGGLTNALYLCRAPDPRVDPPFIIRMFGPKTDEVIEREDEKLTIAETSRLAFGPRIYSMFDNGRTEMYFDGFTFTPKDMVNPLYVPCIARTLAEMHLLPIDPGVAARLGRRTIWQRVANWAAKADALKGIFDEQGEQHAKRYHALGIPQLRKELQLLERDARVSLLGSPSDPVFCHNDLLSGNIMMSKASLTMVFVDYEYASVGPRGHDLANHFFECCGFNCEWDRYPSQEHLLSFAREYLEHCRVIVATRARLHGGIGLGPGLVTEECVRGQSGTTAEQLVHEVNCYALLNHFHWGFWAVVQAAYATIEFDYLGYAEQRLGAFRDMKAKYLDKMRQGAATFPPSSSTRTRQG